MSIKMPQPSIGQEPQLNAMDPIADKNLQALPVEVLDLILLKVVSIPLLKRRAESDYNICPKRFDQDIKALRTVWSEWNYRLTNRWFWIQLKRLTRLTLMRTQKRIRMKHHVDEIVKLKDRLCVLSWSPSAIKIYKDLGNFALEKEIPLDDDLSYTSTIEPNVKSNSVYVQYRSETSFSIQKVNIDEYDAQTIWLKDIQSWNVPAISVTRSDNVLVLTSDRVSLYSAEAELINYVDVKKQFTLHPWKILLLPQGNFVVGFARDQNEGYIGLMGEIVYEGEMISGFIVREDNGRPINLWDDIDSLYDSSDNLWENFSNLKSSSPEFKQLALDLKNHLMFLISRDAHSLLIFDTASLSLVQSIPLQDKRSRTEATEISSEACGPAATVGGLCFDTEKRVLYVGSQWKGTIDVYKVY